MKKQTKNPADKAIRPENSITEEIRRHIEATAAGMLGRYGIEESDLPDIRQELSMRVTIAAEKFDASRGCFYTFAQTVIRNAKKMIYRQRADREGVETVSLDKPASRDSDVPRIDTVPDENDALGRALLVADVRAVLPLLSPGTRKICDLIMAGASLRQIPERIGVSRATFMRRVWPEAVAEVKKFFGE